ncbi:hypothetical protein [Streptomyces sp. AS58]|uniref:hypothetical protein n=1 Tax=Streptomyces sp. AS58 TaxID=1519489 RepID=UPI0006AECB99|nr:hypothetical protein [Streptomyces sp. AS58]
MIVPPFPYSPPRSPRENRPVHPPTESVVVAFIGQREEDEAAAGTLTIVAHVSGPRLYYGDEDRTRATICTNRPSVCPRHTDPH